MRFIKLVDFLRMSCFSNKFFLISRTLGAYKDIKNKDDWNGMEMGNWFKCFGFKMFMKFEM